MADDQATLGSFAGGDDTDPADDDGDDTDGNSADGVEPEPPGDRDRVCPWCLATADRFVETGPTGLACGRCSAALPVGAGWFDAREVVARRPMYDTDG